MNVTHRRARRPAVSDDEVRDYIRARLAAGAPRRKTTLLREFRESGRACEQSRFTRLFDDVRQGVRP